ncbi:MAG: type I-U CRISPR-associated helicase/endonuclease Cas3 [bacterium]
MRLTMMDHFTSRFTLLTGFAPFPWQSDLFQRMCANEAPSACDIPTGLGKTSIIAIWILALARQVETGQSNTIPRRLAYVVNRRTVVDQATREAEMIRDALIGEAKLSEVANALKSLGACAEPLAISTLRGQFADNGEWRNNPGRPAIIVGTVDMIGSRLLFSGYGCGFKTKPLHAGFLGQDSLLIHDEAHLEPAFQSLVETVACEQARCKEFGIFRVMALTATPRGGAVPFGLTEEEKKPPVELPDPPQKPVHVVWRRQKAKKKISLHEVKDGKNLADEVTRIALSFKGKNSAVLVFVRKIDDVEKIVKKLPSGAVQQLTGTWRGLERDALAKGDPIFARFMSKPSVTPKTGTVYLICTSAGEVGVNISADHLVCDLSTFDSMAQRFGRVNRFGDRTDTEIHVLYSKEFDDKNELDKRKKKTLELLQSLNEDGSPKALSGLNPDDRRAAFAPAPVILPATDILFDAWALTSIRGKLPGRPPVEPYLHGVSEWEPPETHVAWREEVDVISGELLEKYLPEDLLDDYPLKPHELLRDHSDRVFKHLEVLAKKYPDCPVWLVDDDGCVELLTLTKIADKNMKARIYHRTVVLPPSVGGLDGGMLKSDSNEANDVADEWYTPDDQLTQNRIRVWDDTPAPLGMRRIREIDTNVMPEKEEDDAAVSLRRYWRWYERPKIGEGNGSGSNMKPVLLADHANDTEKTAKQIVRNLPLSDELKFAVSLAARCHDRGKNRGVYQHNIGNHFKVNVLARSGGNMRPIVLTPYRHEFGSLLEVQLDPVFLKLNDAMKDFVLHLVASHHGRARPHFPPDEAFDPELPDGVDMEDQANKVAQRFARLQRRYGRWGLAYLESLLRAADYAASAEPSAFVGRQGEEAQ